MGWFSDWQENRTARVQARQDRRESKAEDKFLSHQYAYSVGMDPSEDWSRALTGITGHLAGAASSVLGQGPAKSTSETIRTSPVGSQLTGSVNVLGHNVPLWLVGLVAYWLMKGGRV